MLPTDPERFADEVAARVAQRLGRAERPLLSTRDLAERLRISDRKARALIAGPEPRIASIKVGDGSRRIKPEAVDAYLASCEGGGIDED